MINGELGDAMLTQDVLDGVFEMWWPKLESSVAEELDVGEGAALEVRRSDRELLEEVLALSRRQTVSDREQVFEFDHPAWDDLFAAILEVAVASRSQPSDAEVRHALRRLARPIDYIAHKQMRSRHGRAGPLARRVVLELREFLRAEVDQEQTAEARAHDDADVVEETES